MASIQCLLLPSPSSIPLPKSSSSLIFNNLNSRYFSSSSNTSAALYLITCPNRNGLSSSCNLHRRHLKPVASIHSDLCDPTHPINKWDWWTTKFAAAANIPFFLLQMPQIMINARNLMARNNSALLAVSWLGMLTGLLGGLSLLSYFAKKRETEALIVQCLGVTTAYIVISQLAMGQAMPYPYYIATSVVVAIAVISNVLNYFDVLPLSVWHVWEDFITVGGLSMLPQVMWSTFVPYVPNSVLPGAISLAIALVAVTIARMGKLSEKSTKFVRAVSGWTATLLFMWMPIAQMWTNFLNPNNIQGLSALSMSLAVLGNGLLIPRSLFVRDFMWFTGTAWATFLYGWGNLVCMFLFQSISREYFLGVTAALFIWTGLAFWNDSEAYGHGSPLKSLKELVFGSQS